eukprot:COSAG01_NODE_3014_length_6720_cov_157.743845_3_plen_68_part_00
MALLAHSHQDQESSVDSVHVSDGHCHSKGAYWMVAWLLSEQAENTLKTQPENTLKSGIMNGSSAGAE